MSKVKHETGVEAEFHATVREIAAETLELFKDNKGVRKFIRKGQFEDLLDHLAYKQCLQPEIDRDLILEVLETDNGLQELAVDASFAEDLEEAVYWWDWAVTAVAHMPSLTWPVIKVKKTK